MSKIRFEVREVPGEFDCKPTRWALRRCVDAGGKGDWLACYISLIGHFQNQEDAEFCQQAFQEHVDFPISQTKEPSVASERSLHLAAHAWCKPTTQHLAMIPELASVFAEILDKEANEAEQLRVQMAGILTAVEGATSNPAVEGQYGWSMAYQKALELRRSFDSLRQSSPDCQPACSPEVALTAAPNPFDTKRSWRDEV